MERCSYASEKECQTMGISSMSGSFSCSTTQFTAASRLALPERKEKPTLRKMHTLYHLPIIKIMTQQVHYQRPKYNMLTKSSLADAL